MELLRVEGSQQDLLDLALEPSLHVVTASAAKEADERWSVSVFASPDDARKLESRQLDVARLEGTPVTEAAAPDPTGYLTSTAVDKAVRRLADAHPSIAKRLQLPHKTHEGKHVSYLRIGRGADSAPAVLVLGGMHAREWAPPDALVSFAEALLQAYDSGTGMSHPDWVDKRAQPPISYAAWELSAADVKKVVDELRIFIVPLVNPDGRDFSLAPLPAGASPDELELHRMWRKNRRPAPGGSSDGWCTGVDLNRNFDIAWDYERYYNATAATQVACSKKPCDPQVYVGPGAASEPETRNVQELVDSEKVAYFLDVHSFSRRILFPWGMDDDQTDDPSMNFGNAHWDRVNSHGGRDGKGGSYAEFLPRQAQDRQRKIARAMHDAIKHQAGPDQRAARRSTYDVKQELQLYPTTGNSNDYCFSRALLDSSRPTAFAFCLECGIDQAKDDPDDAEGGFQPDRKLKFPKIEREIHAAVFALLKAATSSPHP